MIEILFYAPLLGVLAGFLSGLLGIGGGIVLVPALIYLLPILPQVDNSNVTVIAIATSLFTIIVTAFSSGRSHYKKGNLDKRMLMPTAASVALTSLLAGQVASRLSSDLLTQTFAVLLAVLAIQIYRGGKAIEQVEVEPSRLQLVTGGTLTGFLAALAGLGGGAILVPYLTYIGANIRKSIAVAAACGMVVAFFGSLGYLWAGWNWTDSPQFIGFVHWPTGLMIMAFSYFAAPFGVKAGQKLDQKQLKKVFAIFMLLVATRLLFQFV